MSQLKWSLIKKDKSLNQNYKYEDYRLNYGIMC